MIKRACKTMDEAPKIALALKNMNKVWVSVSAMQIKRQIKASRKIDLSRKNLGLHFLRRKHPVIIQTAFADGDAIRISFREH
mmetsp:Transcript_43495/g.70572  ORF Transcript_43495/g.70572 Transcript_43495/m.70572 type:complete len:82 (+) Transcript_43495:590-835(+)